MSVSLESQDSMIINDTTDDTDEISTSEGVSMGGGAGVGSLGRSAGGNYGSYGAEGGGADSTMMRHARPSAAAAAARAGERRRRQSVGASVAAGGGAVGSYADDGDDDGNDEEDDGSGGSLADPSVRASASAQPLLDLVLCRPGCNNDRLGLRVGEAGQQGTRPTMEDTVCALPQLECEGLESLGLDGNDAAFFAVYVCFEMRGGGGEGAVQTCECVNVWAVSGGVEGVEKGLGARRQGERGVQTEVLTKISDAQTDTENL